MRKILQQLMAHCNEQNHNIVWAHTKMATANDIKRKKCKKSWQQQKHSEHMHSYMQKEEGEREIGIYEASGKRSTLIQ